MFKAFRSFFNPLRIRLPFLIDLIIISNPEQIKKIETSGDVDRLHVYETKALPWWVRSYFKATKFYDADRDLWFCPFEPTSNPTYYPRRTYLEEKVAESYSQDEVKQIAKLLTTNADDDTLTNAMVQVVNRRFFGEEIPSSINEEAKYTVQKITEAILPWKYLRGRQSQQAIMNYCAHTLPPGVHLVDAGHNIGEVVQATAGSLKILKKNADQSIGKIFTENPPTPQVTRIAIKASTLDGLLSSPMTPGKTVVVFQVGKAARQTKDLLFTFGAGVPERSCVFKDFFIAFMTDLQKELIATEESKH